MSEERPGEELPEEYGMPESLPYVPYGSFPQQSNFEPASTSGEESASTFVSPDSLSSPTIPVVSEGAPAPKKSRRRRWVIAGIVAVLVLLLASVASYFTISYINRSTPNKTLDTFCNALQHEDYLSAYNQFSPGLQKGIPEADFATVLSQDKITVCTHGNTNDSTNSVTTNLKLVHASKGINADVVTLAKDSNSIWKITNIARQ
jgi:hypothetical protein